MISSNFEICASKDTKSGNQHLSLKGEIGINSIDKIKIRIDGINLECDNIFIELRDIESFDLSSVQLLYSLRKSLEGVGKTVIIVSELSEIIRQTLKNAGFDEFFNSLN